MKHCPRCRVPVHVVVTEPPCSIDIHVSVHPVLDVRAETPPYFERLTDDRFVERYWPQPRRGGVLHAVHHCAPPARCRQCEQVHTTSPDPHPRGRFTSTIDSESETAA